MERSSGIIENKFVFISKLIFPFAFSFFISVLYRTSTSVLSPYLITDFSLSAADLGLVGSSYFIAFAIAQPPLGVALDRFGARRTLSILLLFAVCGSLLFSKAYLTWHLIVGRGLIGIGVSGCLMAAFKAYKEWLTNEELPLVNSYQALAGGLGAIIATQPIHVALAFIHWRELFYILATITFIAALLVYKMVPQKSREGSTGEPIRMQFMAVLHIARSAKFWQITPAATMVQASFIALNTLWVGPWLKDVYRMDISEVAFSLMIISIAVCSGYFLNGLIAHKLRLFGISTESVCKAGMVVFTTALGCIGILENKAGVLSWVLLMLSGPFSLLAYSLLVIMFEKNLAGRVITLYNFMVFVTVFFIQWVTGIIINLWPPMDSGYHPQGYQAAFLVLFLLNAAMLLWMVLYKVESILWLTNWCGRKLSRLKG